MTDNEPFFKNKKTSKKQMDFLSSSLKKHSSSLIFQIKTINRTTI